MLSGAEASGRTQSSNCIIDDKILRRSTPQNDRVMSGYEQI
jgi:hypothetical protein